MIVKVAASLLSCDFAHLASEVEKLEEAKVDEIHLDIMDGNFVPNLSMGPKIVSAVRRFSKKTFLNVHLMTYHPDDFIESFIEAGANGISFHYEATEDVEYTLDYIRKCNGKAGLAFNPETPFSSIPAFLPYIDFILLMSVSPGFGGQKFQKKILSKIKETRKYCEKLKAEAVQKKEAKLQKKFESFDIYVDGGINLETGKEVVKAGCNVLVSGTYLFSKGTLVDNVKNLKSLGERK